MTNKEQFVKYATKRLKEKEYKKRTFLNEIFDIQIKGVERCSRSWRMGQK